jgi:uncharacterized protein
MGVTSGLALGLVLGFLLTRSGFCMHSAMRDVVARRAGPSVQMWLVALAVQLLVVNALIAAGAVSAPLPVAVVAAASVGGVMFGAGMVLAKG